MTGVAAIAHITTHLDAGIGLALGQRGVEFFGRWRRHDGANFEQFSSDWGRDGRGDFDGFGRGQASAADKARSKDDRQDSTHGEHSNRA